MSRLSSVIGSAWERLCNVPIVWLTIANGTLILIFWLFSFVVFDHAERYKYPAPLVGLGGLILLSIPYYAVKDDDRRWHGFGYVFAYVCLLLYAYEDLQLFSHWLGRG